MSRRSPIIQDESNTDPELEPLAPSDPACPDRPAPFKFITVNVYCSEVVTSRERKKGKRMVCDCQFDPEQDDPEVACGEICLNRLLMIECGSRCPCGEYCNNKRFQRGVYAQVEVFKTDKKGWGLCALTDIPQGTFVMEYCGEILDATQKGNNSRFINHSCDPNCETQKWTVQGKLRIGFFTVRDIQEGEEITFDYQFQRFGDVAQKCYCGSANCRGYLGQSKTTGQFRGGGGGRLPRGDIGSPREAGGGGGGWRRRHTARADNREDSMFEKQIYDIVGSSWRLKNTDQVIAISRIMLQAERLEQRVMLLHVLQATEDQSCLRKFLSLHGLRLLWSWMVDSPEPDSLNILHFRQQTEVKSSVYLRPGFVDQQGQPLSVPRSQSLRALLHLPITTRNQVSDSHLLTSVTRWLKHFEKPQQPQEPLPGNSDPPLPALASGVGPQSLAADELQPLNQRLRDYMEATVVTEADSHMDSEPSSSVAQQEEVGSCDSVGVVMHLSCDPLTHSQNLEKYPASSDEAGELKPDSKATFEGGMPPSNGSEQVLISRGANQEPGLAHSVSTANSREQVALIGAFRGGVVLGPDSDCSSGRVLEEGGISDGQSCDSVAGVHSTDTVSEPRNTERESRKDSHDLKKREIGNGVTREAA
ncbi:Histone-lysine N-methyltransferase SETD2 [Geodia barretti]|uniref:Histone-lysine N-methyltransferase SETD2 n=1 Tax=Geodia barretti TaxID=519541 RepID=A0AA35WL44_GEOBA|nr:Histone-lysine N-methyltransferase SETD2 [Geodia barretti]